MGMNRVDAIVDRAYRDLDQIYGGGARKVEVVKRRVGRPRGSGESAGDEDARRLVLCAERDCPNLVEARVRLCPLHTLAGLREAARRKRAELERVIEREEGSSREIDLRGLSGQGIIDRVLEVTGELIPVCRKSKVNVIRHARVIADRLGMTVVI